MLRSTSRRARHRRAAPTARAPGRDAGRSIRHADSYAASDGDVPRIFLYDAYPGGIGFSEPLFTMHAELLARTQELIAECPCENGCPSCVGPVGQTGPLAKTVALRLLDHLTQRSIRSVQGPAMSAAAAGDGLAAPVDEVPF